MWNDLIINNVLCSKRVANYFEKTGFVVKSYFLYTKLDCHNDWIKVLPFLEYFIVAPRTSFDSNTFSTFTTDHNARDFLLSWIKLHRFLLYYTHGLSLYSFDFSTFCWIFRTPSISKMFRKVEKMLTTFVKIFIVETDTFQNIFYIDFPTN